MTETGQANATTVENEAVEQVAFADRIVLNKIDLVDGAELAAVADRLQTINAMAEIIPTSWAKIDLDRILGVGAFDLSRTLSVDPTFLEQTDHSHDLSVISIGIELAGDLHPERLNAWLGRLLAEQGVDIFRMKGILAITGDPNRYVCQGVHMLFDGTSDRPWGDTPRTNRLVFIGRNLDRAALTAGLRACSTEAA